MKYPFLILIVAALFLCYRAYETAFKKNSDFAKGELSIFRQSGGVPVMLDIQIADNISKRAQGLMDVKKLGKNSGMLFIYDNEESRKMWMKNTIIPLDMMFIDSGKNILGVKENAVPLSEEIIYSANPALYVLETNGGFIKENDIKPGDKIEFKVK